MDDNTKKMLILNMIEDVGSVRTRKLLEYFGSLEKIFQASKKELSKVEDIGSIIAARIPEAIKALDIKKEIKLIEKYGAHIVSFLDKDYPSNLKNIYDPPMALYVKGEFLKEDSLSVAVVGSRRASFYGLKTAQDLGFELASRGVTVVSGLARGIDSAAHKGALEAKGRTIAVLGSGLMNIYPEEHIDLAAQISESGAVISEFPMETIPDRGNFPKRNRIISGLSLGVVIVEAGEQSGALITGDFAMEQGREVFAVPGKLDSMNSKGTNNLIKQGARLLSSVDDILEELDIYINPALACKGGIKDTRKDLRYNFSAAMDKNETLVYNLLSSEPQHIDNLAGESGVDINELSRILMALELKKIIRQLPGKNFVKV